MQDDVKSTWSERDWVYPPVVGSKGYIGSEMAWFWSGEYDLLPIITRMWNVTDVIPFPLTDQIRRSPD